MPFGFGGCEGCLPGRRSAGLGAKLRAVVVGLFVDLVGLWLVRPHDEQVGLDGGGDVAVGGGVAASGVHPDAVGAWSERCEGG